MKNDIERAALNAILAISPGGYAVGVDFEDFRPTWLDFSYPLEWSRHYADHNLIEVDPTITFGLSSSGHITWRELSSQNPGNPVMQAAADFGLSEGNTLAIQVDGRRSIMSCCGSDWSVEQIEVARVALLTLHAIHAPPKSADIPERIRQTVRLMCDGLRDDDIAKHLAIKVETVRQRRQAAYRLSGTETPASLGAYAQRAGWLKD